jgi:hypothetical protein
MSGQVGGYYMRVSQLKRIFRLLQAKEMAAPGPTPAPPLDTSGGESVQQVDEAVWVRPLYTSKILEAFQV